MLNDYKPDSQAWQISEAVKKLPNQFTLDDVMNALPKSRPSALKMGKKWPPSRGRVASHLNKMIERKQLSGKSNGVYFK